MSRYKKKPVTEAGWYDLSAEEQARLSEIPSPPNPVGTSPYTDEATEHILAEVPKIMHWRAHPWTVSNYLDFRMRQDPSTKLGKEALAQQRMLEWLDKRSEVSGQKYDDAYYTAIDEHSPDAQYKLRNLLEDVDRHEEARNKYFWDTAEEGLKKRR
jgi:hypothetical protein